MKQNNNILIFIKVRSFLPSRGCHWTELKTDMRTATHSPQALRPPKLVSYFSNLLLPIQKCVPVVIHAYSGPAEVSSSPISRSEVKEVRKSPDCFSGQSSSISGLRQAAAQTRNMLHKQVNWGGKTSLYKPSKWIFSSTFIILEKRNNV